MSAMRQRRRQFFGAVHRRRTRRYCRMCQERWPQLRGLCALCAKALGLTGWTTQEREAARIARPKARLQPATPAAVEDAPTPIRTVVISGEEFDITWDGSVR